ncbi:MAG: GIN domain-containing protein [Phenylobacterium sp.]
MIRTLVIIVFAGLALCIASLTGAVGLGFSSKTLQSRLTDMFPGSHIQFSDGDGEDEIILSDSAPKVTRKLAWDGADTLETQAFADVTYIQGPARSVTLEGPAALLDRITVKEGRIDFEGGRWRGGALKVVVEAPDVTHFDMGGVQDLKITGYKQDEVEINLTGAGRVTASGKVRKAALDISGRGAANLAALEMDEAEVELSGAGKATLGPTFRARIDIRGVGQVELTRSPARLEQSITGAGRVSHRGLPG